MNIERRIVEDVRVLTPTTRLPGGQETEDLLKAAEEILAQPLPRIVVDLGKIDYFSSSGLGALVRMHVSCINRGGWMRLVGLGPRLRNILAITSRVFDTYETLEEAITTPRAAERPGGTAPSQARW